MKLSRFGLGPVSLCKLRVICVSVVNLWLVDNSPQRHGGAQRTHRELAMAGTKSWG